jgi:uncharacterized protein (DUF433 family)
VLSQTHIVSTPDTMHGAPRIDGHRIRVQDIVVLHLGKSRPVDAIAEEFGLNRAQVHSALAYYYDHQQEIEAAIQADADALAEFRIRYPSRLQPKRGG